MTSRKGGDIFNLQGTKTPIWTKPGCFSNSEMTIKPKSKKKEHDSSNSPSSTSRRHAQKRLQTALSQTYTPQTFQGSDKLTKSVTFDSNTFKEALTTQENLANHYSALLSTGDLNDSGVGSSNGTPMRSSDEDPWFTRSYHITKSKDAASEGPLGTLGVVLSSDEDCSHYYGMKDEDRSLAGLASDFFPVTLNASKVFQSIEAPFPANLPASPRAKGLDRPNTEPWKPQRSKSPRRQREKSPRRQRSKSPAVVTGRPPTPSRSKSPVMSKNHAIHAPTGLASQTIDKMYLMATEAPTTASSSVYITSPFQAEIARLKMQQLRLEEQHLLEVKRQEELERIRGPQPHWYELKTPDFHYEARKNNTMNKEKENWQALLDYRTQLVAASNNYTKTKTT